jgi:hypothetical protein
VTIALPGRWDAGRPLNFDVTGVRRLEIDMRETSYLDAAALAGLVGLIRVVWSNGGDVRVRGGRSLLSASYLDRALLILDE